MAAPQTASSTASSTTRIAHLLLASIVPRALSFPCNGFVTPSARPNVTAIRLLAATLALLASLPASAALNHHAERPLREASATLAAAFLAAGGVPVTRAGTTLITPGARFEVLIACSGGKMLAASLALAAALAVLGRASRLRRIAALAAAAPLALAGNALRVSALVLAGAPTPPHLHAGLGYAAFTLVALALLALATPTPAQPTR